MPGSGREGPHLGVGGDGPLEGGAGLAGVLGVQPQPQPTRQAHDGHVPSSGLGSASNAATAARDTSVSSATVFACSVAVLRQ